MGGHEGLLLLIRKCCYTRHYVAQHNSARSMYA